MALRKVFNPFVVGNLDTVDTLAEGDAISGLTNGSVLFYQNGLAENNTKFFWNSTAERLVVGDASESISFFPTNDTKLMVNRLVTSIGTSFSPIDIIKLLAVNVAGVQPSADTNTGLGITIYGAGGNQLTLDGSKNFNGGLPFGSQQFGIASALANFSQTNIICTGTVDGAFGALYSVGHFGTGSATAKMCGGAFESLTDDSQNPGAPTGSIALATGGEFAVGAGGANITEAWAGVFREPVAYDAGNGYGTSATITKKTAVNVLGTMSWERTDTSSTATENAFAVYTSWHVTTGTTAETLNGIADGGVNGKLLLLTNGTNASMTVNHENGSASASNRIITATGAAVTVTASSSILFAYDTGQSRWRHIKLV